MGIIVAALFLVALAFVVLAVETGKHAVCYCISMVSLALGYIVLAHHLSVINIATWVIPNMSIVATVVISTVCAFYYGRNKKSETNSF